MAASYRVNRVRQLLLREFSGIIGRLKDPRIGMVNLVDVEVSKDLRYAKLFVSVIGSEEEKKETLAALQKAEGFLRREAARLLTLRFAPEIKVLYDNTAEQAAHISTLLQDLSDAKDG